MTPPLQWVASSAFTTLFPFEDIESSSKTSTVKHLPSYRILFAFPLPPAPPSLTFPHTFHRQ